jgi:hypothetical protein
VFNKRNSAGNLARWEIRTAEESAKISDTKKKLALDYVVIRVAGKRKIKTAP